MADNKSFYSSQTFLNAVYSLNISLESHFSNLLFLGQPNRMIWASNDYAFYQRAQNNNANGNNLLDFPFTNYKLKSIGYPPVERWTAPGYTNGVMIDEIQKAIQINPVYLEYESTYFCNRQDEALYAYQMLRYDEDIKTTLDYYLSLNNENGEPVQCTFRGKLDYPGSVYEPEYNEKEWLEKNNIHSFSMDFVVDTFFLSLNENISIPTSVIATFNQLHNIDPEVVLEADQAQGIVDYYNQVVTF